MMLLRWADLVRLCWAAMRQICGEGGARYGAGMPTDGDAMSSTSGMSHQKRRSDLNYEVDRFLDPELAHVLVSCGSLTSNCSVWPRCVTSRAFANRTASP